MNEKYVMVLRNKPGRNYFLISVKAAERVGALADLSRVLAVRGFDILEGHVFVDREKKSGYMTFFAEATTPTIDASFVSQLLERSDFESVSVTESRNGLIIDTMNFPVMWGTGDRALVFQADAVRVAFKRVIDRFGEGGKDLVHQLGFEYGKGIWDRVFSGLPLDTESLQYYLNLYAAIGLAKPSMEKFEQKELFARIRVDGSFECEDGNSHGPSGTYLGGVFAGSLSSAFGKEMEAKETKCVSTGSKYCEFELKPRS